jgi:hypothetical protein
MVGCIPGRSRAWESFSIVTSIIIYASFAPGVSIGAAYTSCASSPKMRWLCCTRVPRIPRIPDIGSTPIVRGPA